MLPGIYRVFHIPRIILGTGRGLNMDTLVVELMQKRLEKEINEALKHLELQVGKIEFRLSERLALIINLKSLS